MELKKYIDGTSTSTTTVPTTTPRPTTGLKLNCPHHNLQLAEPRKGFRWQGKVANWEACAERCRKIKDCQYWQYWGAQEQKHLCATMKDAVYSEAPTNKIGVYTAGTRDCNGKK